MRLDVCRAKLHRQLCQNCVTYPPKPWGNTVIYGDTSTHSDVAEVVESEVRWWDWMCVSTRERNQFPSVLLQLPGQAGERQILLIAGLFTIRAYRRTPAQLLAVSCIDWLRRGGI